MSIFRLSKLAPTSIVCLCTLGGVPTAHAQSSVTLYGVIDASLRYTSKTLDAATGANAGHQFSFSNGGISASRFGLSGREDLGDGLHAIFTLESGFTPGNGEFGGSNGTLFGRQSWVGLDGRFGTVKAGLQYSPFFLAGYPVDPRTGSQFGSGLVNYLDNVVATGLFNPNAVSYTSPEIAGLQAAAMFAPGGSAGSFRAGLQHSASVTYHTGPIAIAAGYYSGNAGGSASTLPVPSTVEFEGRMVGASYTLNKLTAKVSYTLYKVAGSFDNHVYAGGVTYAATSFLSLDAGVWVTRDGNDSANHSLAVSASADYGLSKSTLLYLQVGMVNNHGSMDTGLAVDGALHGVRGTTVGVETGIRHMF
ncbi:porin [Burkholderia catarinensis]|uniref:porin n=1 Tax=Burkholderia catarinensis TaxID=1108140 RepID=UPI000AF7C0D3|nr:porin [Burkholderia catarinensis]KAG8148435.1 porin [Burkholderia catarinensis]